MFERILLPISDDRSNQRQLLYAEDMAAAMGADLCLLHVAMESRLGHRVGGSHQRDPHVSTRIRPAHTVLSGRVDEAIARHADAIVADLILMPTRGCGLFGQLLFGSTTLDVLRIADRPLWVVKPKTVLSAEPVRCKRILCAVELGAEGELVLRYAARLADAYNAELLIVHAIPGISEAMLIQCGLDGSGRIELLPGAARRRIGAMAAPLNVSYEVQAEIGDVAAIVRRFARQWRADVVVVGRGRRADRWQHGANVGDIIARSPCPVITVPGEAWVGRRPAARTAAPAAVSVCGVSPLVPA